MKKIYLICLIGMVGFCLATIQAIACSCYWKGPFLAVAKEAPLVVRGKILRHHPGKSPAMDVLVFETLSGGLLDSGLTIQMGDGMHCRPMLEIFPPDTEWILAINGPGSKAGNGLAISHCGEYWLKVENGSVVGSIDGDQNQVTRMPLEEFKNRFLNLHLKE
ncbi:MAG: hypothetical protein KKA60_04270 [Proteobacteria bacterium]|nr:hypothetical protein [Pseudomonadota bacterium]